MGFQIGDPVFVRARHVQCGTVGVIQRIKPGGRPYVIDGLGTFAAHELVKAAELVDQTNVGGAA